MDFTGKLVLVTGGARGVGRAVATKFAQRGARVLVNYFHSRAAADSVREELQQAGAFAGLLRASVAKREQVAAMFDTIAAEHGYLDILVNNAAAGALLPISELADRDWDRAVDTNIKGALWCAQHAVPLMRARGGGAIVNLSSMGANFVLDNYLTLGTTKAAVEALTRYLAAEYAHERIRVNAASCSNIDGQVMGLFPNSTELAHMVTAASPLGRLPTEREYANLVLFLASEEASWITGQTVLADGGLSLGYGATAPSTLMARGRPPWLTLAPRAPLPSGPTQAANTTTTSHGDERIDAPIAVVGMGMMTPGARDPDQFWKLLCDGRSCFTDPGARFDMGAFYDPNPEAENRTHVSQWGFAPEELSLGGHLDYAADWLRHVLRQALDPVTRRDSDRVALVVGCNASTQHLEESLVRADFEARVVDELRRTDPSTADEIWTAVRSSLPHAGDTLHRAFPVASAAAAARGILPDDAELLTVDSACSSALYALDLGVRRLQTDRCDVAVSAGVHVLNPTDVVLFTKTGALSSDGEVRAFDRNATGTLFSDGAAVVVLKTLDRAREDGDEILCLIEGIGLSSDGRGKAIFAPNATGQRLAIDRALRSADISPRDLGLIVAHATGTPAGDAVEMATLSSSYADNSGCPVVSNKSVVGHTGWAAGLVSVAHATLAMQNSTIPAQRVGETIDLPAGRQVRIPHRHTPWPSNPQSPRRAAVSAFGFGGTNAHVILREYVDTGSEPQDRDVRSPPLDATARTEPIVLVDWSADLPGAFSREEVEGWLLGSLRAPATGYGDHPAPPPINQIKAPPNQVMQWDRTHVMALRCAHRVAHLFAEPHDRDRVGVIAAHCGPTRNMALYSQRIHLANLRHNIVRQRGGETPAQQAFDRYADEIRMLIPPTSPGSEPGKMANIISGRVANYFDLHGPNLTVDTGVSSAFHAIDIATDYLRSGELDLAVVVAVNGNSLPGMTPTAGVITGRPGAAPAEGAFLFVLARRSIAERDDLPIMAMLSTATDDGSSPTVSLEQLLPADRTYLAADPAIAILRAVLSQRTCAIRHHERLTNARLGCTVTVPAHPERGRSQSIAEHRDRYSVGWREERAPTRARQFPPIPERCVLLTSDSALVTHFELPDDTLVVAAGSAIDDDLTDVVVPDGHSPRHLRAVIRANPEHDADTPAFEEWLKFHEAMFAIARQLAPALSDTTGDQASVAVLILDAFDGDIPRASTGLFTGFIKSLAAEFATAAIHIVLTSDTDPVMGLRQLAQESAPGHATVVAYLDGRRRVPALTRLDSPPTEPAVAKPISTVVATGGARGITAELLCALAAQEAPKIWILGTNDLTAYPPWAFDGDDEQFLAGRREYLQKRCAESPGLRVADARREWDRMRAAREANANIERLRRLCGNDRVRYLACDVTDAAAVDAAMATVLAEDPAIDLVLHGAGLNRPGQLARKTIADFRSVRDVKVRGHVNLHRALRDQHDCRWMNMGSLAALIGLPGELDYTSGNDFLASAAAWSQARRGCAETTVEWTRWDSTGLAAGPLTRELLSRTGNLTAMSSAEGVELFLAELADHPGAAVVAHLGPQEWNHVGPMLADTSTCSSTLATPRTSSPGPFYCDRELSRSLTGLVWERTLDSTRDAYLSGHIVDGRPTMPGAFATELAAEIAGELVPDKVPIAFEFLRFHRWLRPHPKAQRPFRIIAQAIDGAGRQQRVRVRICSDVVSSTGAAIRTLPHFEVTVVLADQVPAPPLWLPGPILEGIPVATEHYSRGDRIEFDAPFRGICDIRRTPLELAARYTNDFRDDGAPFTRFRVPAVLIDAMIQLCGYSDSPMHDRTRPVVAVGRVDLYGAANDRELVTLYPTGIGLRCRFPTTTERSFPATDLARCYAISELDNRMLVELRAVEFLALKRSPDTR